MGMWIVEPDLNRDGLPMRTVVHIDAVSRSGRSNDLEAGLAVGSYNPFTGVFQRPQIDPVLNGTRPSLGLYLGCSL